MNGPVIPSSLDELLAAASARIRRRSPVDARAAVEVGAVLVDIRSNDAREDDGIVPGSLHIPRTVLEWRVAPGSPWRNPHVDGAGEIILLCDHGYSSILAAATLVDLGFVGAGDVIGGFEAWREAGLPVEPAPERRDPSGRLPGMGGPDA